MGLDITAYRQLKPCEKPAGADDGGYDYDKIFKPYPNPDFPGRDAGLVGEWFGCRYDDGFCHDFRAGSYSGYNEWREWLAKLAGYPVDETRVVDGHGHSAGAWAAGSGPFFELIHFADNEGTIGPVVSAKLAKDFADWDERAKAAADAISQAGDTGGWLYASYCDWRKAFEMAADGGAVDFH